MNTMVARAVMLGLLPRGIAPGLAQDTQAGAAPEDRGTGTLEEIVVTAQKRETNLQETPISVAVLTAGALDNRQAISLASLSGGSIPTLRVAPFATRSSALNIGIRGIGASGARRRWARRCMTSGASRCSSVRRARCSAASPKAAPSASRIGDFSFKVDGVVNKRDGMHGPPSATPGADGLTPPPEPGMMRGHFGPRRGSHGLPPERALSGGRTRCRD